ncbi:hypothetical protein RUM43_009202 [Polyplax serrata]|uniref:Uncharacterized protein n=1 Tax=Polyplax serrata TaxID=468196 RepID=A0AAN8NP39_POLSC
MVFREGEKIISAIISRTNHIVGEVFRKRQRLHIRPSPPCVAIERSKIKRLLSLAKSYRKLGGTVQLREQLKEGQGVPKYPVPTATVPVVVIRPNLWTNDKLIQIGNGEDTPIMNSLLNRINLLDATEIRLYRSHSDLQGRSGVVFLLETSQYLPAYSAAGWSITAFPEDMTGLLDLGGKVLHTRLQEVTRIVNNTSFYPGNQLLGGYNIFIPDTIETDYFGRAAQFIWNEDKDWFTAAVHNNAELSNKLQKLEYLKTSVKGEAVGATVHPSVVKKEEPRKMSKYANIPNHLTDETSQDCEFSRGTTEVPKLEDLPNLLELRARKVQRTIRQTQSVRLHSKNATDKHHTSCSAEEFENRNNLVTSSFGKFKKSKRKKSDGKET